VRNVDEDVIIKNGHEICVVKFELRGVDEEKNRNLTLIVYH
jgi:hypothetical protein